MNESAFLWIVVLWTAAIGGSVGSFLNVVVYRLPAGINLSYPGSHCPKCQHPIRWYDNVPVFGWLMLGGRCRDCRARISVRYPAVEAFVAALFVLILVREGATFGANLPARPVPVADGLIYPSLTVWQLAGLMGWHLLLLCTLLAASLIRYDGHEVPIRLFAPGFAVGLVGSIVWPHLHPQPAVMFAGGPTPGFVDGLVGLVAGTGAGFVMWRLLETSRGRDLAWSTALAGLMLGWQAVLVVGAVTIVSGLPTKLAARRWNGWRRVPLVAWLGFWSAVWIFQWNLLAEMMFGMKAISV